MRSLVSGRFRWTWPAAACLLAVAACLACSGSGRDVAGGGGGCVELASGKACEPCIPPVDGDWVIRTPAEHAALFPCADCAGQPGGVRPPVPAAGEVLVVVRYMAACPICFVFGCGGATASSVDVVFVVGQSDCDAEPSPHAAWLLLRDVGKPVRVTHLLNCP